MSSVAEELLAAERSGAPEYFGRIKQRAASRWDQLEADPELAGPWHQLFKQVQSPRHILSELLQNADDAGAGQASVCIVDGRFVFEHDGDDFVEAHFASICRFGYSNKRALHTIGFRGIGFKSTFSLGGKVELYTPSLAVAFERARFTEPHWLPAAERPVDRTRVEVPIADERLEREVRKNLDEWLRSPTSLLFFKNLRQLKIGDAAVRWESLGAGPVEDSEWMALDGKDDAPFLLVRSKAESFPSECLAEIRQERMLGAEDAGDFPPCRVEIVLGAKGRLYVVLPTGVETPLPFACNAPFIQDPARLKIKDPETSPTNRWLLQRAGALAADAMMAWLGQTTTVADRARAYGLMPDVEREATSLEGASAAIAELAFADAIEGSPILLTEDGGLAAAKAALVVPPQIFDIWPLEQAMPLIDKAGRPALSRHVAGLNKTKLSNWGLVESFSKGDLVDLLRTAHLPRPPSWRQLLNLWAYVAPELTGYSAKSPKTLRIVPVQGKDVLYAGSEVVRLGEKKLLQSDDDWEFLAGHLLALNQNWTRYLADQRRDLGDANASGDTAIEAAFAVLKAVGLSDTSDVNTVIERVAGDYFGSEKPQLADCVRLAQIAARLGAGAGDSFRFATRNLKLRAPSQSVLYDEDGSLEDLLPEAAREAQLLHSAYAVPFKSCSREEWTRWINSGKAGLETFTPLVSKRPTVYSRPRIESEARARGHVGELYYHYVTSEFVIEDWDFDAAVWQHWEALSRTDERVWSRVADRILAQRDTFWSRCSAARILQVATTGSTRSIAFGAIRPAWAQKLRDKTCLPDTRGVLQLPADLLRRTPETESLIDVEPFVAGLLDRETTRPLLDLLGVRSTPTGPGRLLDRIRALAKAPRAPAHEVEKWYRRLDQMLDGCSTLDAAAIKTAFRNEKLILCHDAGWGTSDGVYLIGDEDDVPGAALIRASVADLSLWRRIGVADRPSAELALTWLKQLPSGAALAADDAKRVKALLARYPLRVWEECGHWINLAGEWAPVDTLAYALSMQSLFRWAHLHDWVKAKTADLRLLANVFGLQPLAALPALGDHIDERLSEPTGATSLVEAAPWLLAFGRQLRRVVGGSPEETDRLRTAAEAFVQARWITAPRLEVIPYLDGVPAGTARQADVLWINGTLFAGAVTKAKLAKRVPEELGKGLGGDIQAGLAYAFERSPDAIRAYLEENFTLDPEIALKEPDGVYAEPAAAPAEDSAPQGLVREEPAESAQVDGAEEEAFSVPEDAPGPEVESIEDPHQEDATPQARPPRPAPKPPKADLIERFALSAGFRRDGSDRFFHPGGAWLARSGESKFPWERRSAAGELERVYLAKEHCLEREPLQIEADVWALLEQRPDAYAFILTTPEGAPVEVTGARLRALRDSGDVKLHPATYRLVYDRDR